MNKQAYTMKRIGMLELFQYAVCIIGALLGTSEL